MAAVAFSAFYLHGIIIPDCMYVFECMAILSADVASVEVVLSFTHLSSVMACGGAVFVTSALVTKVVFTIGIFFIEYGVKFVLDSVEFTVVWDALTFPGHTSAYILFFFDIRAFFEVAGNHSLHLSNGVFTFFVESTFFSVTTVIIIDNNWVGEFVTEWARFFMGGIDFWEGFDTIGGWYWEGSFTWIDRDTFVFITANSFNDLFTFFIIGTSGTSFNSRSADSSSRTRCSTVFQASAFIVTDVVCNSPFVTVESFFTIMDTTCEDLAAVALPVDDATFRVSITIDWPLCTTLVTLSDGQLWDNWAIGSRADTCSFFATFVKLCWFAENITEFTNWVKCPQWVSAGAVVFWFIFTFTSVSWAAFSLICVS